MEAECYQKIGKIEEQIGNLDRAVEFLQKFLHMCEDTDKKSKQKEAHQQLADVFTKSGNITAAIRHLSSLVVIANDDKSPEKNVDLANAYLKLGLLHYS